MGLKFVLSSVYLGFNVQEPTVKVVLSEDVGDLIIVFQSVLEVLLSLGELLLYVLYITQGCFTTRHTQSTTNISKQFQCFTKLVSRLPLIPLVQLNTRQHSNQICLGQGILHSLC